MKKEKTVFRYLSFVPFFLCLIFVFGFQKSTASAKQELEIKAVYTNNEVTNFVPVEIQINSTSAITDIRYAYARVMKATYFSKYKDNGTKIEKKDGVYTFNVTQNGYVSVYAKNKDGEESIIRFTINYVDSESPSITVSEKEYKQKYKVTISAEDNETKDITLLYLKGAYASPEDTMWEASDEISNHSEILLDEGKYTFLAIDQAGNTCILIRRFGSQTTPDKEFRAVWISYLDFKSTGYTKSAFREHVIQMFNECCVMNMNAVVVHVRPFGDAMYPSSYFPWSRYVSGEQGKDPGFDPLQIMIEEAHSRGLEFHAWLNPYRITSASTNVNDLSEDNPARVFRTDSSSSNDRNVLTYDGKLFYNPASKEVQTLITNGIKEIVLKYKVDGIHFDDYFYPSLGKNYQTNFDAKEYTTYSNAQKKKGETPLSIDQWRRENVNSLIRSIYSSIKSIDSNVIFGISPGGFLDALRAKDKYYVDVDKWLGYDGYIDYLCPQLYWSNDHSIYPYDEILQRFIDLKVNPDVKLYVGVGAYKAGIKTEGTDWYKNPNVLSNMITTARKTNQIDGYVLYGYKYLISKRNYTSIKNLIKQFK